MAPPPADEYLELAARLAAPPPRTKTHREVASSLLLPDGPAAGEYLVPESEPAQGIILDAMDGKILDAQGQPFRDIIHVAATQTGKSLVDIIVPSMAAVMSDESVIYCLPTGDLIGKVWTTKLLPTIRGCGLGGWLPDSGPGSRGGKPAALTMVNPDTHRRAGSIIFIAGGEGKKREVGQAGVTARRVLIDEADEYEDTHRVALVRQRAASFGRDAITITTSTVKKDENSVILALYSDSTASRIWFACPDCGRYQPLEWSQVRYDETDDLSAAESARYICTACACAWDEAGRHRALAKFKLVHTGQSVSDTAELVGSPPRTRSFGLRTGKLDYHIGLSLGDLAVEHRRAKLRMDSTGDHGLMRSFHRDRLSLEYKGDQTSEDGPPQQLTRAWLAARSAGSSYSFSRSPIRDENGDGFYVAQCPDEVEALTLACDVQRGGLRAPGRLYFLITGSCSDMRSFDLAWGSLALAPIGAQPNTAELHAGLDRLNALGNDIAAEYARTIVRRGVDVGDRQDEIRQWLIRNPQWWAVKGVDSAKVSDSAFDIDQWIYRRPQHSGGVLPWFLYLIDVDKVRRQAQMGFLVPPGKPGAAHVPRGILAADSIAKHYCGTALIPDGRGGVMWSVRRCAEHFEWNMRHDLLDCRTYALAMAHHWVRGLAKRRAQEEYHTTIQAMQQTTSNPYTEGSGESWV